MATETLIVHVADNQFGVWPDSQLRLIMLDVGGEPITIVVEVRPREDFEAFIERTQPIIDSIRFMPG